MPKLPADLPSYRCPSAQAASSISGSPLAFAERRDFGERCAGMAGEIDEANGLGAGRQPCGQRGRVDACGCRIDIDKPRHVAERREGIDGRNHAVSRDDDLISRLKIECLGSDRERDGSAGRRRAMRRTGQCSEPSRKRGGRLAGAEKSGCHLFADRLRAVGTDPGLGERNEGHASSNSVCALKPGRRAANGNDVRRNPRSCETGLDTHFVGLRPSVPPPRWLIGRRNTSEIGDLAIAGPAIRPFGSSARHCRHVAPRLE